MKPPLWRQIQKENFTSLEKLADYLTLNPMQRSSLIDRADFPLNLPKRLAEKIEKSTLDDPILKQFLPIEAEKEHVAGFQKDPVGDCQAALKPMYLKKYAGRALLMPTSACAMHCRFCFRQKYAYQTSDCSHELDLIQKDHSLQEIILSGGDPLSLSNASLKQLIGRLNGISHLKRLRFHTRFPVGIPERIDDVFLQVLEACRLQVWFVIHCNHFRELDSDVLTALKKIQKLGIPLLNQWVLLKGINDSIETLQTLCEQLIDHGIFPYYMHQLDRVEGSAHFEVEKERGLALIQELTHRLAGYGIPKYVQEQAGSPSKTLLI